MDQQCSTLQEHEARLGRVQSGPSVLRLLNCCSASLEHLLNELRSQSDAEPELRAVAAQVLQAIALDADIALAAILLNRIAATYPVRHCVEVALVATLVARASGQTPQQTLVIAAAALTMNVAMLAQHDSFQSQNATLTRAERDTIQRHPQESVDLLQGAGVRDQTWLSIVLQHHEMDDGSGYPEAKIAADIAPQARLVGLADRYCALISARNYRRSMLPGLALRTLLAEASPELASHFNTELGPYPPGTLVRLCNGEIGVVARRARPQLGTCLSGPCIHVLRGADGAPVTDGDTHLRDGAQTLISEALHEDQVPVRFSLEQVWGAQAML
jgi:HD-GYP domain-containing protein (c-di-GMP phosphodiesterase class II)